MTMYTLTARQIKEITDTLNEVLVDPAARLPDDIRRRVYGLKANIEQAPPWVEVPVKPNPAPTPVLPPLRAEEIALRVLPSLIPNDPDAVIDAPECCKMAFDMAAVFLREAGRRTEEGAPK